VRWPPSRHAAALLALAVAACGAGDVLAPGGAGADAGPVADAPPYVEGGTLADRLCPAESFLTYQNFGSAFFSEYCTGCHSSELPPAMRQDAPETVNFETLDKVRAEAPLIYLRAADAYRSMPPVGGPSGEERALLGEWLACGAPE
jgi:hypothetical protein